MYARETLMRTYVKKMTLRHNLLQNVSLLQALPRQHFVLVNVYDFYSVHADSRS